MVRDGSVEDDKLDNWFQFDSCKCKFQLQMSRTAAKTDILQQRYKILHKNA